MQHVYEDTDEYGLGGVSIKPQILKSEIDEAAEHNVVFSEIQETVIQGIRDAKFLIWAAVAWFSNETIYQELLIKKRQGLDIRLIISDEESNERLLPKLQR